MDPAAPYLLDDMDLAILAQLQDDGRKSYTEIARALSVSVGTVRNRITRMTDENVVRFICRPDAHRAGFHTPANIKIIVRPSSLLNQVVEQIMALPEVYYLALLAGEFDLDLDVMCRDQEHLSRLVTEGLQKIPGVYATNTSVILKTFKLSVPDLGMLAGPGPTGSG